MKTTYTAVEVENLVRAAREDARKAGVAQERARVFRCRNEAFRGVRMAMSQLEALGKLDGMLLRGEDPGGPAVTLPAFDLTTTLPKPAPAPGPRVTDEELAEVARLDAVATPGPWLHNDHYQTVQTYSAAVPLAAVCRYGNTPATAADHELIARARMLLPRLAAEVTVLRAEVAERDAQIARLAVDSAAAEAKLTIEAMAANQRAADLGAALASARARLETIGDIAGDILLATEDSAVPDHSDVPTRLIDALRKAADR